MAMMVSTKRAYVSRKINWNNRAEARAYRNAWMQRWRSDPENRRAELDRQRQISLERKLLGSGAGSELK